MRVNLLKRLESSVDSFRLTLNKVLGTINDTIKSIDEFEKNGRYSDVSNIDVTNYDEDEYIEELLEEDYQIGNKVKKALEKKRKNLEKIEAKMYEEQKAEETFTPAINHRKKDGHKRNLSLFLKPRMVNSFSAIIFPYSSSKSSLLILSILYLR